MSKVSAGAVANYLIENAGNRNIEFQQLGLMKRLYIVHGFSLGMFNKSILDAPYDRIEAWKYGPVIPSIYHEIKHFGSKPIPKAFKCSITHTGDNFPWVLNSEEPMLKDKDIKKTCDFILEEYQGKEDRQLIALTQDEGTPWWQTVRTNGYSSEIPNDLIKNYYEALIKKLRERTSNIETNEKELMKEELKKELKKELKEELKKELMNG